MVTSAELSWELQVNSVFAKANKILGILKRTCTQITEVETRRTLYLSLVKSQLCYATKIWLTVNSIQLSRQLEKLLINRGELTYTKRLRALDFLPLTYDREIKDLFLYKALFGYLDIEINNYVSFVSHCRTRLSQTSEYMLKCQLCRTTTYQSYYNRVTKIWNTMCKNISIDSIRNPISFKRTLKRMYSSIVDSTYDVDMACTWSLVRSCPYVWGGTFHGSSSPVSSLPIWGLYVSSVNCCVFLCIHFVFCNPTCSCQ